MALSYRAVDSKGNTIDFLLTAKRDKEAAKRFLRKLMSNSHHTSPRVITIDQNAAYPLAIDELKTDGILPANCEIRQCKYLNSIVEQDHRFIKWRVKVMLGFGSFHTANRAFRGIEIINIIHKGQIQSIDKGDIIAQLYFIDQLFDIAA